MSERRRGKHLIDDLIDHSTHAAELRHIVKQFLDEQQVDVLGEKSTAAGVVSDAIVCVGVFAPAPFEPEALKSVYENTFKERVSDEEFSSIVDFCKDIGVFTDADRGLIEVTSPGLQSKISSILNRYC